MFYHLYNQVCHQQANFSFSERMARLSHDFQHSAHIRERAVGTNLRELGIVFRLVYTYPFTPHNNLDKKKKTARECR